MERHVTVVVAARNAAATIERCMRSALEQGGPIVLVDDFSTDETAAIARGVAGGRLTVVSPARHETIGAARQAGIEAVTTKFAMWIDADDEALRGRSGRLLARLEREGADIVYDAANLHDGATGALVRHLPIPEFLLGDPTGVRQFERNVIPSLGWPLVRTSWAQRLGYDPACHGVEDYDFLLRSIMEGARVAFEPVCGYRQFAYATSVSRELGARRAGVRAVLAKHEYAIIRARYLAAGYSDAITAWALVAVAIYRQDWDAASAHLADAARTITDPCRVLEPEGPCPRSEGWRLRFYRGTLGLLTGRYDVARRELAIAHVLQATAESANNLGVALARFGLRTDADEHFREALRRFPAYLDPEHNLASDLPSCITTHPLRTGAARVEYPRRAAS
jgi:succinoglycan biosynthesis protein ExoO